MTVPVFVTVIIVVIVCVVLSTYVLLNINLGFITTESLLFYLEVLYITVGVPQGTIVGPLLFFLSISAYSTSLSLYIVLDNPQETAK